jgi:hypothetical protein
MRSTSTLLNRFATLGAKALLCFKSACESALFWTVGLTLGIMLGTDEILLKQGGNKVPIFYPAEH